MEPYFPIHVGKALSNADLGIQGDDTGDNISLKNESYCELTGMYWAWKNLKDVDIIGLCHYRRFFDFHHQCESIYPYTIYKTNEYEKVDLTVPEKVLKKLDNNSIVVSSPIHYDISLFNDYCRCHISDDIRLLERVMKERNDNHSLTAFRKVMYADNRLRHYNMFLMTWGLYCEYCKWLFGILKEVEEITDISNYNSVQKRIYGYMAERLLNVFIESKKLRIIEKKVIWFNDDKDNRGSKIRFLIHKFLNDFSFIIGQPRGYIFRLLDM